MDRESTYLEKILCGFIHDFFTALVQTCQPIPSNPVNVTILSPIYSAKVVIDFM